MAHFYGTIQGHRGQASRLGSKNAGFKAYAASWQGAVDVWLYERNGKDFASIELRPHYNGRGTTLSLYDGPISGPDMASEIIENKQAQIADQHLADAEALASGAAAKKIKAARVALRMVRWP